MPFTPGKLCQAVVHFKLDIELKQRCNDCTNNVFPLLTS